MFFLFLTIFNLLYLFIFYISEVAEFSWLKFAGKESIISDYNSLFRGESGILHEILLNSPIGKRAWSNPIARLKIVNKSIFP